MKITTHKTKIVATIGPASESREALERLILAGMSVARLNFSHGSFAEHAQRIDDIRAAQRFSRHRDIRTVMIYDDNRRDIGGQMASLIAEAV